MSAALSNRHEAPYALHGKKAKTIWFGDEEGLTATDSRTLVFEVVNYGDRHECWIAQHEDGVEVARHNCRFIASIEWVAEA